MADDDTSSPLGGNAGADGRSHVPFEVILGLVPSRTWADVERDALGESDGRAAVN